MNQNIMKKSHGIDLSPGTQLQGKWHKNKYVIQKKLGEGTVGAVYLCQANKKQYALKISKQTASMTMEVNVLKALNKVQEHRLGPYLLETDDWLSPNQQQYSFYVMEYIRGKDLAVFIKDNGYEWIGVFLLQLLDILQNLHKIGLVFGDLKIAHLIVTNQSPTLRLIDVGGITKIGRSIKEFTEFYDRGYWNMGTRRAEPSYDLFALVMVFLEIFYPNHFVKTKRSMDLLFKKVDAVQPLRPFHLPFKKALLGKYKTAEQMKQEIITVLFKQKQKKNKIVSANKNTSLTVELIVVLFISLSYFSLSILFH